MTDTRTALFPEVGAGGYTRRDGTVEFFTRVNALLRSEMSVLDFGAGRGEYVDDPVDFRRELRILRGKVARVAGVDVDDAVLTNVYLDDAAVVDLGERLPYDDQTFDLILADWVFEHVERPAEVVAELDRLLRPGGWICARTPNKWGYVGMAARAVPNGRHTSVLRHIQPTRKAFDAFPVAYRMNTRASLKALFPASSWDDHTYAYDPEPSYGANSALAWRMTMALGRALPARLAPVQHVFLRKR